MNKVQNSCLGCSLRNSTILKNCRYEFLEQIDKSKYSLKYLRGQQLFREGSEPEGIYVICNGIVMVQQIGLRHKPFILHLATTGDMVGHQLNATKKNLVSAIAVEETNVCFIESKDFEMVLQKSAPVREDLTSEFNKELNKIYMRTVRLAQMTVREKVADSLLMIARAYQINDSGKLFDIHLSRQDIGDLSGVNKEQVSKIFSEFKDEKIIVSSGKHLQILNYNKLKEIIE